MELFTPLSTLLSTGYVVTDHALAIYARLKVITLKVADRKIK